MTCSNCPAKTRLVENWSTGDRTCTNCGMVQEERMIVQDAAEYRIFQDDDHESSSGRVRVGASQSIFAPSSNCDLNTDADEKLFHTEGLRLMEDFFASYYPYGRAKSIEYRAREIYDCVFRHQKEEKTGTSNSPSSCSETTSWQRVKYSRKKTYLVGAIWIALMETGASHNKWSVDYISRFFGAPISEDRVKRSLKCMHMDMGSVSRTAQRRARERRMKRVAHQRRFAGPMRASRGLREL
jgi:transcription initiation factor TFIIIB Brf1 subunit/transcription initiation factor TFIIB